jgi:steroid delta-isomerase-like uncharacterized protein
MIVEEPHAVVYPVAAARGGAPMLPRLSVRWLIPLTLVVLLLACCGDAADGDAEAIAAVEANEQAYSDAFFAKDLDGLMDTFADDAIFIDETFGDHLDGKVAIKAMYWTALDMTDPDLTEVTDLFIAADGTFAANESVWIGTNSHGKPFHLPTATIHEYRDGKIVRETMYYASPNAYTELAGG